MSSWPTETKYISHSTLRIDAPAKLTGKARYRRMLDAYAPQRPDGRIASTWEVIYLHAFGAPEGQPQRTGGGEIATFSVDRLRGSRRG